MPKKKNLVVVESPTKTKSIAKYLGKDFSVTSSKGHIIDLPKSKLGVDVENNYEPLYQPIRGKGNVIKELKKLAKTAGKIYLATDLDREGEAIAWHIASALEVLDKKGHLSKDSADKVKRVVFSEITKDAILEAFDHPRDFDYGLIDAYQARRVLDRLVGYKLSPLLWKKIQFGLSAGRVQSVALRLIVEREKEREDFKSTPYYKIAMNGVKEGKELTAELTHLDDEKIETKNKLSLFAGEYTYSQTLISTKEKLEELENDLKNAKTFIVSSFESATYSKKPSAPFSTSTLQRSASTRLGLTPKSTMYLAQQLYEEGYITYHRTDSFNLSEQFVSPARDYIKNEFGDEYLPDEAITYASSQKNAQEAHEAIRPTSVGDLKEASLEIEQKIEQKAAKLYELIYSRAVASQMTNAQYKRDTLTLKPNGNLNHDYVFSAQGSILTFDGFIKMWGRTAEDRDIPQLKEGDVVDVNDITNSQHDTSPPPRYTDSSLIKDLEEHGIGRPSTYAPTIDTIIYRNYVGRESSALVPSDIGKAVTHLLVDHFPDIVDLSFTADMENQLDDVAEGKGVWQEIIDEFYKPFEETIEKKEEELERSDYKVIAELDEKCPDCDHILVSKLGRYGKFKSCSNFPECKYAAPFIEKIGMNCPDCKDGDIIIRHTKRGKIFYGCSNYPKCKWASWEDPRKEEDESA
ncbi:type I DNA topoisomerase [candidate division WWE3 bacterium]|uniref:DNA topoisomerase 1 n=1 Tax=candidate division WWE3 bacterium TaxID=2053526 RepID=A0A955RRU5_UNCKA|nr:type I DNA topoisomerase [candidate division WWE3 bacterium]